MAIAKQIWIDLLMEGSYPDSSFLSRSVDMTPLVEYNKINLAEAGVDPKVLVDNNVFPVPSASREDSPLELPLHTFDTENTIVRHVEEKETSYDKMESVVRQHRAALQKATATYAALHWAPVRNTEATPVLAATGAKNAMGKKAATFEDFLRLEARFRDMDADLSRLVAVLNAQHMADLMAEDMKLYKDVLASGKLFSFSLFNFSQLPYYTASSSVKVTGKPNLETDAQCSLIYLDTEVMRADGTIEMFAKLKDPAERGDVIGFQKRFTALPIRGKGTAAIYSPKTI